MLPFFISAIYLEVRPLSRILEFFQAIALGAILDFVAMRRNLITETVRFGPVFAFSGEVSSFSEIFSFLWNTDIFLYQTKENK